MEVTDRVIEVSDRASSGDDASDVEDDTSAEVAAMNAQTAKLEKAMAAKRSCWLRKRNGVNSSNQLGVGPSLALFALLGSHISWPARERSHY